MNGRGMVPPALFTTTSIRPNSSIAVGRERLDGLVLDHVGRSDDGSPPECLDLAGDRFELLRGARGEDDVRARLGERQRGRGADAAARAGDDRDLAVEPKPFEHSSSLEMM